MWSKTKKALKRLWCDSLIDRVDVHYTSYPTNANCGRAWITVDGDQWLELRDCDFCAASMAHYRNGAPKPNRSSITTGEDLVRCIASYLSAPFDELIVKNDDLTQILVSLDRRLGKRRLQRLDWTAVPDRARQFFELRCRAENVSLPEGHT